VKQLALRTALTSRIADGDVISVDSFTVTDGKTRSFLGALKKVTDASKVLVIGKFDEMTFRAGRNVRSVQLVSADEVNAEHLLTYGKVVLTGDAIETLAKRTA
jgi:large subunit ribosomal protein L4